MASPSTLTSSAHLKSPHIGGSFRPIGDTTGSRSRCERAARELNGIAEVQRLLLPTSLPSLVGYDLAVSYEPADLSGGDYYDFLPMPGGRMGFFIADVNGHGAAATIGMAVVSATARAAPDRSSPAHFMSWMNEQLANGYASGRGNFVTAFYAVLEIASGKLTYASAGHNPPLICSSRGWTCLDKAQRMPLGVAAAEQFRESSTDIMPGSALVLYTDGITEARNSEGLMFGAERLAKAACQSAEAALATAARVRQMLGVFSAHQPARDDQTLVVLTSRLEQ